MKCPHCKEKLESIGIQYNEVALYEVSLQDNELYWEKKYACTDKLEDVYCPICNKSLDKIQKMLVNGDEEVLKKILKYKEIIK